MTKQKQFFRKLNITFIYVFRPFTLYFVEAPLAVITALSLLGYDATSLVHLYLGSFSHYSLQILSRSVRLNGELHSYFQESPEMFVQVKVRALAGPLKDIQSLVPKPLLRCLGCVFRVVGRVYGAGCHQGSSSVLCSIHLALNPE